MTKLKPFDAGGWFPIHNYVFDVIMPRLSPNGWKVLCVAIRQTWGWAAETPLERREWDRISYSQFRKKAGIASDATVRRALKECLESGYILRHQVGRQQGTGKPLYAYALNRNYEVEIADDATATTESVVAPSTDSVVAATTESVETKQRETNKQSGGGGSTEEQEQAFILLTDFGVSLPVARDIAGRRIPKDVQAWVDHARNAKGLRDPVGLVVRRLLDDEPAPTPRRGGGGKSGRITTAVCQSCYRVVVESDICPDCGRCGECCECE